MLRKHNVLLIIFTAWALSACSQLATRHEIQTKSGQVTKSDSPFDNDISDKSANSLPSAIHSEDTNSLAAARNAQEAKVAVVLGPGGYKAFAHTGVLKEFKKNNIPVHKVVGIEWGALVAGLFAQRGQINEAEWKLYKLEKLDLNSTSFFSLKKKSQSLSALDQFLATNLDFKEADKAAVPFSCPSLNVAQGTLSFQERGAMHKAVAACLAFPPLYMPEQGRVAGMFAIEEIVGRLKKEGYNVIVLVNVLGDGNLFDNSFIKDEYATAILWNEARRQLWQARSKVTDVVDVNTRGISMSDFDSRKVLTTAGEAAGEKAARALTDKYGF